MLGHAWSRRRRARPRPRTRPLQRVLVPHRNGRRRPEGLLDLEGPPVRQVRVRTLEPAQLGLLGPPCHVRPVQRRDPPGARHRPPVHEQDLLQPLPPGPHHHPGQHPPLVRTDDPDLQTRSPQDQSQHRLGHQPLQDLPPPRRERTRQEDASRRPHRPHREDGPTHQPEDPPRMDDPQVRSPHRSGLRALRRVPHRPRQVHPRRQHPSTSPSPTL